MPNEYTNFCLCDLRGMIRETALETMLSPSLMAPDNGELQNALLAVYNDGIKTLADELIKKLTEDAKHRD